MKRRLFRGRARSAAPPVQPDGRARPRRPQPPPEPGVSPSAAFLLDDQPSAIEHGERGAGGRVDTLVGTSASHTPAPDIRAEEPSGELGSPR